MTKPLCCDIHTCPSWMNDEHLQWCRKVIRDDSSDDQMDVDETRSRYGSTARWPCKQDFCAAPESKKKSLTPIWLMFLCTGTSMTRRALRLTAKRTRTTLCHLAGSRGTRMPKKQNLSLHTSKCAARRVASTKIRSHADTHARLKFVVAPVQSNCEEPRVCCCRSLLHAPSILKQKVAYQPCKEFFHAHVRTSPE
jgi:hypothetical protein